MFNCWRRKPEKPNYAKIIAITVAVVAAVSAIAFVLFKLFNKYFSLRDCECEDFLDDGCEDCDVCFEDDEVGEVDAVPAADA